MSSEKGVPFKKYGNMKRDNRKDKKIHNKNYHLLKKSDRKNPNIGGRNGYRKKDELFDDRNEREELQLAINEQLELLVEENKKHVQSTFEKEADTERSEEYIKKKKEQVEKKEQNLTVIDKNVLTDKEFKSLPISKRTLKVLDENGFTRMTNIQAVSIPIVLLNKHIYAQAQTGTGKTLCFGIPLIEKLYRNGVDNKSHILEGVVISPTRELVFQIFEVLNMLNKYHKFHICCVIGGKNEEREKGIFSYANIVVCTPGRLLFHLENNYFCNLDYVSTLVIDEIDKLVDSSFYNNLQNILLYKPREDCQICLFSATMCKYLNVILKTFHVKNYEYVSINDKNTYIENNNQIKHIFIECSIYEKINYLYTFLFSKREKKIMVFFSTCKQVRFMFEIFKKVKVGVMKFLQLHGKMKQVSRLNTYSFFSKKKNFTCLFTTDIGCRGLDFSNIDWVIHFDVPENIETFIHRSGRTGRLTKEGNSLIFLTTEIDNRNIFLKILKDNNIEIKEKNLKHSRLFDINNKIHSINAAFTDIKHLAKTALVNYLRHLTIVMKFKNIDKLDLNKLADTFGLAQVTEEMKRDIGLTGKEKPTHRKKQSRLQKFLEIMKNKKEKKKEKTEADMNTNINVNTNMETTEQKKIKGNKPNGKDVENDSEEEEETEEEEEAEEEKEEYMNDGIMDNKKSEPLKDGGETIYKKKKKQKEKSVNLINSFAFSDDNKIGDNNDGDDDGFFQKRKVEIEGEGLALMPKKKKKRVKVAGVLSNSVLYDDDCNEINAETQKIKFLIGDLESRKERTDTKDTVENSNYLNELKQEIEETNKQMKKEKYNMNISDTLNISEMSDNSSVDEQSLKEGDKEEEKDEETEDDVSDDLYTEKLKKKKWKKQMHRKMQKKKKAETKVDKENTLEKADITELENEALLYLK